MIAYAVVFLPLIGSILTLIWGRYQIKRAHVPNQACLMIACLFSFYQCITYGSHIENLTLISLTNDFSIQYLGDILSRSMTTVVLMIAWLVHIYSTAYMKDDIRYDQFFFYIGFFTFGMNLLVISGNFFQTFVAWEWIGLVSYGLIGFWYRKDSAQKAALKAFFYNRIGDTGLLIGLGLIFKYFSSLDYSVFLTHLSSLKGSMIGCFYARDVIAICFLIGIFAKSAQIPLHDWLSDSMEGPRPFQP